MDVVLDHPSAGPVHNIGNPVKMSGTPPRQDTAAPLLGEHTDEILEYAGYSAEEIAGLHASGAAEPRQ